ncbi:MAG: hypothetical protein SPK91_07200 [Bacteroidales bacterium]|nr:hypothetical protein [Bacteroidales bacterium]
MGLAVPASPLKADTPRASLDFNSMSRGASPRCHHSPTTTQTSPLTFTPQSIGEGGLVTDAKTPQE